MNNKNKEKDQQTLDTKLNWCFIWFSNKKNTATVDWLSEQLRDKDKA